MTKILEFTWFLFYTEAPFHLLLCVSLDVYAQFIYYPVHVCAMYRSLQFFLKVEAVHRTSKNCKIFKLALVRLLTSLVTGFAFYCSQSVCLPTFSKDKSDNRWVECRKTVPCCFSIGDPEKSEATSCWVNVTRRQSLGFFLHSEQLSFWILHFGLPSILSLHLHLQGSLHWDLPALKWHLSWWFPLCE